MLHLSKKTNRSLFLSLCLLVGISNPVSASELLPDNSEQQDNSVVAVSQVGVNESLLYGLGWEHQSDSTEEDSHDDTVPVQENNQNIVAPQYLSNNSHGVNDEAAIKYGEEQSKLSYKQIAVAILSGGILVALLKWAFSSQPSVQEQVTYAQPQKVQHDGGPYDIVSTVSNVLSNPTLIRCLKFAGPSLVAVTGGVLSGGIDDENPTNAIFKPSLLKKVVQQQQKTSVIHTVPKSWLDTAWSFVSGVGAHVWKNALAKSITLLTHFGLGESSFLANIVAGSLIGGIVLAAGATLYYTCKLIYNWREVWGYWSGLPNFCKKFFGATTAISAVLAGFGFSNIAGPIFAAGVFVLIAPKILGAMSKKTEDTGVGFLSYLDPIFEPIFNGGIESSMPDPVMRGLAHFVADHRPDLGNDIYSESEVQINTVSELLALNPADVIEEDRNMIVELQRVHGGSGGRNPSPSSSPVLQRSINARVKVVKKKNLWFLVKYFMMILGTRYGLPIFLGLLCYKLFMPWVFWAFGILPGVRQLKEIWEDAKKSDNQKQLTEALENMKLAVETMKRDAAEKRKPFALRLRDEWLAFRKMMKSKFKDWIRHMYQEEWAERIR